MSSPPNPASLPLRNSSKKVKSDHHTPSASEQAVLQKRLLKELHNHAWEFGAERVAEMLSADGEGPTKTLVESAHEGLRKELEERAPDWPTVTAKRVWCPLLRHS